MRSLFLLLVLWLSAPTSAEELLGRVISIADGDTLTLLVDRQQTRVRLAQIDTPERGQPWARRARQALSEKVFRKDVRVEVVDVDRYGRTVGQVWLGDRDINREMVAEGHAWAFRRYLTDRSLLEDEKRAREAERGLWSQSMPVPPWEWRRGQRSAESSSDAGRDCNIKGNIARDGERIYHVPGQRYYAQTRISTGRGERWFCSEREAREAGWRKARE